MYGMIHKGVRQMVIDQLGEEAWSATERKLGIGPTELVTGMVYEDSLTIEIIAEAADRLNLDMENCLVEFGRYWIKFAERGSFASFMDFTGQDFPSFISNLDRMHLAVATAMPKAQVPSFSLIKKQSGADGSRISIGSHGFGEIRNRPFPGIAGSFPKTRQRERHRGDEPGNDFRNRA